MTPSVKTFESWFAETVPGVPLSGAVAVLKLAAEGATVPFMARYRKEQTGNLDEVGVQLTLDAKERWDGIQKRQAFILEEIERQQKLSPELAEKIRTTFDQAALEDLYLPFKKKRKTKAAIAREAGLEPLADLVWALGHGETTLPASDSLESRASALVSAEAGFADGEAVLLGAQDILTERLAEMQDLRQVVRDAYFKRGFLRVKKGPKAKEHSKFEPWFDYAELIAALQRPESSHRYLAVRRGWMEEELALDLGAPPSDPSFDEALLAAFERRAVTVGDCPGVVLLRRASRLALKAHVVPSIESEVHKSLKDLADVAAISVFAENVRQLLLASPFGPKAVLGVDPGLRTGCKVALVDDGGKYVVSSVMHLQTEDGRARSRKLLGETLGKVQVRAIAVGNGTAGRETLAFLRDAVRDLGHDVPVVMVSESGASIYSASDAAREEFPDLDLTVRGAISIARRLQDPLAELVKVDPKSIGVGQYQHDVSQPALKRGLDNVVLTCVNQVGVNLNTASYHLLAHVSGVGPALARAIVEHRGRNGLFRSRQELLEVPRFSKKTFEQAAGFLRIPGGVHPLDNTGVHPERYASLEATAARLGRGVEALLGPGVENVRSSRELLDELGEFTFADVIREIEKPGRDPRESFVAFDYRDDVHEMNDLREGMVCPGLVTNVTNFGAFIDIGVHQDGLAHVSELADRFVKDPREVLKPGDRVKARVLSVDLAKRQIALSLRSERPKKDIEARPDGGRDPRPPRSAGGGTKAPSPRPQPPAPKAGNFNNPFAALGSLGKPTGR